MGKFEMYTGKDNQYRFRLKARNGEIILKSEGYTAKSNCEKGIESVKKNAPLNTQYERLISSQGDPYFNLRARNGEIIGTSETYSASAAMEVGIASVKLNAPLAVTHDLT